LLLMAAGAQAQAKPGERGAATVDDQEARDLFRLGKQAFDEGRYERALKYFKDAYDLSGRAALQFNIGTVLDRLRRDREAIEAYQSYLTQTPDATNRSAVEERVRWLQDAQSKPAAVESTPSQPPASAVQPAATAPSLPAAPPPQAAASTPQASAAPPPEAEPPVPSPAETARAAVASEPAGAPARDSAPASTPVTSRWWFWTGLGAVAVGAVVLGVALGSSSSKTLEGPAVLGAATRVRSL
jgi:tetratricopeptide (TPR) repeat protein